MARTRKRTAAEEIEHLHGEVMIAKALSWPTETPEPLDARFEWENRAGGAVVQAWTYNTSAKQVWPGCFSNIGHATTFSGRPHPTQTTSQGMGGPWFSTKRDALLALRASVTREMAVELARLDRAIATEAQEAGREALRAEEERGE